VIIVLGPFLGDIDFAIKLQRKLCFLAVVVEECAFGFYASRELIFEPIDLFVHVFGFAAAVALHSQFFRHLTLRRRGPSSRSGAKTARSAGRWRSHRHCWPFLCTVLLLTSLVTRHRQHLP